MFDRVSIDASSQPFRVIDCFLSNYEIPLSVEDVYDITNLPRNNVKDILAKLQTQNIIKTEKDSDERVFLANFISPKTMGLFQYYRAVLDENLEKLSYNKR